jgi:hypothetical protein
MIQVKGGAVISPLPSCTSRTASCPETDRLIALWQAENLASQRCVRALIVDVGGTIPSAEIFWLIDAFVANLTWTQVQIVATHPDVVYIESNQVAPMSWRDGGPA